jgi:hypothetical protein
MNYKRIYDLIIEKRKLRSPEGYYENHHIVPKSLSGTDSQENIVALTGREHFICHYLLVKIYEGTPNFYKLLNAFLMMNGITKYQTGRYKKISSRTFEYYREHFSKMLSLNQSGDNNSQYNKIWIYNPTLKQNMKISSDEKFPEGWYKGRVMDWNKFEEKIRSKEQRLKEKENKRKIKEESNRKIAEHYFSLFKEGNYSSITDFSRKEFPKSLVHLIKLWKKYIREFQPKQGIPYK